MYIAVDTQKDECSVLVLFLINAFEAFISDHLGTFKVIVYLEQ